MIAEFTVHPERGYPRLGGSFAHVGVSQAWSKKGELTVRALVKTCLLATVASLSLGLAACDSNKENAAEDAADSVRQSAEATADAIEANADASDKVVDGVDSAAENAAEDKADAVRKAGEAKADALEDKADKADKTPG
jgi:hypothetical protein